MMTTTSGKKSALTTERKADEEAGDNHAGLRPHRDIDRVVDVSRADPRHFFRTIRGVVEDDVQIIATSVWSSNTFERAREAGADIVLPKPLDLRAVDVFLSSASTLNP